MTQDFLFPFLGGTLIGIAVSLMLWLNGRVTGNSGIIAECLPSKEKGSWRIFYIFGLICGALIYRFVFPDTPGLRYNPSFILLIIAGLLVGYGTRLGSGCTSGHGICGIARLSPRSIVATLIFMVTAIITVWVMRQTGSVWW